MNQLITNYKILSSDCDRYGFWKVNRILVLMQELAGEHSDLLGCSFEETCSRGAVWVVTRNEFQVDRYPIIGQTVVGKTYPGRTRRGIYPRYYLIEDEEGRPLVRGSSFWVLADINTRQMMDIKEIADNMPDTSGLTQPFRNPGAVQELTAGFSKTASWQPLYTDLDRNGHVNNTRPADWGLCFLNEAEDLSRHPIRSLTASYHHEMLEGDTIGMHFFYENKAFSLRCDVGEETAMRLGGALAVNPISPGQAVHD